jgi:hypothetical protein
MTGTGHSLELVIEYGPDRYVLTSADDFTFGRDSTCSLCLDPADSSISRRAGVITREGDFWFLVNRSSTRQLDVAHESGIRNIVPPSRRYALEGSMRILVHGGKPKPYTLYVHAPTPHSPEREESPTSSSTQIGQGVRINQNDRLALVALFAGYLEDGDRYDPHPRSYEAAATRLGWKRTTLVRRIEYLRLRLDQAGVPNMTGPSALVNLAEYVLNRGLITKDDLRLLPGR